MAKCPVCNSRKSKRKCQITDDSLICSLCCGTQREADKCAGCSFYQQPRRKYDSLPAYGLHEMDGNPMLEERANSIESAVVGYDMGTDGKLSDDDVIAMLEQLLNVYHFGDTSFSSSSELVNNGAGVLSGAIVQTMAKAEHDEITKILGTVRASAKRRSKYGRDYLAFIRKYVGMPSGSGMRVLNKSDLGF